MTARTAASRAKKTIWVVGEGPEGDCHARAWGSVSGLVDVARFSSVVDVEAALTHGPPPDAAGVFVARADRAAVARRLIAAGAALLVAAPVAAGLEEATALCATAESKGLLFVPAHPILYTPGLARLMAFVFGRRLGPVQNVFSYRYGPLERQLLYPVVPPGVESDLYAHLSVVKTLCLLPESRFGNVVFAPREARRDYKLMATMYYEDDILATVRCDPDLRPPRRGVMVTFPQAVLQWEMSAVDERLTMLRDRERRELPLASTTPFSPHEAMVQRFLRSLIEGVPPYQTCRDALSTLELAAKLDAHPAFGGHLTRRLAGRGRS